MRWRARRTAALHGGRVADLSGVHCRGSVLEGRLRAQKAAIRDRDRRGRPSKCLRTVIAVRRLTPATASRRRGHRHSAVPGRRAPRSSCDTSRSRPNRTTSRRTSSRRCPDVARCTADARRISSTRTGAHSCRSRTRPDRLEEASDTTTRKVVAVRAGVPRRSRLERLRDRFITAWRRRRWTPTSPGSSPRRTRSSSAGAATTSRAGFWPGSEIEPFASFDQRRDQVRLRRRPRSTPSGPTRRRSTASWPRSCGT